jgi:hypothetical protein
MRNTLVAAVLAALAVFATACGGSGDDEESAAAAKSISDSLVSAEGQGEAGQFFDLSREDADCIGDGMVEEIGLDQLREYGLVTDDNETKGSVTDVTMSAADAKATTNVLFECTEVESMVKKAMAESGQIPEQFQDCVDEVLDEKALRNMFTKIFNGKQDEAQQALVQPMLACASGQG